MCVARYATIWEVFSFGSKATTSVAWIDIAMSSQEADHVAANSLRPGHCPFADQNLFESRRAGQCLAFGSRH